MKNKKKCLYTNMLNRLSMLDEQMFEMQANLAMVREWVASKIDVGPQEEASDNNDTLHAKGDDKGEQA
jgi:hypothetical protein|tara:strand:- start:5412 stop:5615 length:204 start_codon:yes stop_codon:yes gene_type:complete